MYTPSAKDERLTDRTIKIIRKGGRILLKKNSDHHINDTWYIHQWTNLAAGPDAERLGRRNVAMEIFDLKWAFALAELYDCRVVVVYPKS